MRPALWIAIERDKEPPPNADAGPSVASIELEGVVAGMRVDLAESIVYLCALIADQPRAIDRYIDYFGETRSVLGVAP